MLGPRRSTCPWCYQLSCKHCRCLGYEGCDHKPVWSDLRAPFDVCRVRCVPEPSTIEDSFVIPAKDTSSRTSMYSKWAYLSPTPKSDRCASISLPLEKRTLMKRWVLYLKWNPRTSPTGRWTTAPWASRSEPDPVRASETARIRRFTILCRISPRWRPTWTTSIWQLYAIRGATDGDRTRWSRTIAPLWFPTWSTRMVNCTVQTIWCCWTTSQWSLRRALCCRLRI